MHIRVGVVLALFVFVRVIEACQCAPSTTTTAAGRAAAAAVFEGRVCGKGMLLVSERGWWFPVPEYEFNVTRAWKGVSASRIRLRGGYDNCARIFKMGDSYLVFSNVHSVATRMLSASQCDATRLTVDAGPAVTELGAPEVTFSAGGDCLSSMSLGSKIRAYAVGGLAAFANVPTHIANPKVWAILGVPSIGLLFFAVVASIVGIRQLARHRALAVLALIVSSILMSLSIIVAGEAFFRDGWFRQFLS